MKTKKLHILAIAIASLLPNSCTLGEPADNSARNSAETNLPVVVIDPGHGGTVEIDESSPNNASYRSEKLGKTFKEKDLTLEISKQIVKDLNASGKVKVLTTRTRDVNVGMKERAGVALSNRAAAFVSIHLNSAVTAHGPVAIVQGLQYKGKPANNKEQRARDMDFGHELAEAVAAVSTKYGPRSKARDSEDFKSDKKPEGSYLFRYLREEPQGKSMKACFLEIDFMDNPAVAAWLLERPDSVEIRKQIATNIAKAIIAQVCGK